MTILAVVKTCQLSGTCSVFTVCLFVCLLGFPPGISVLRVRTHGASFHLTVENMYVCKYIISKRDDFLVDN